MGDQLFSNVSVGRWLIIPGTRNYDLAPGVDPFYPGLKRPLRAGKIDFIVVFNGQSELDTVETVLDGRLRLGVTGNNDYRYHQNDLVVQSPLIESTTNTKKPAYLASERTRNAKPNVEHPPLN